MAKVKLKLNEQKVRRFVNTKRSKAMEGKVKLTVLQRKMPGQHDVKISFKEAQQMVYNNNYEIEIEA